MNPSDPLDNWNGEGEYPLPLDDDQDTSPSDDSVSSGDSGQSGSLRDTKRNIDDLSNKLNERRSGPNPNKPAGSAGEPAQGSHTSPNTQAVHSPQGPQAAKGAQMAEGAAGGANTAAAAGGAAEGAATAATTAKGAATAGRLGAAAAEGASGVGIPLAIATIAADPKLRGALSKTSKFIILFFLLILLAIFFIINSIGTSQHINTKELTAESDGRIGFNSIQTRASLLRNEALFTDPAGCSDEPVYCLLTPGLTQAEIDSMRKQEITIEDGDIQGSDDKFYLSQLRYRDMANSIITTVNSSNFPQAYREDSNLYEKMERVTSSGSIFFRSPLSVQRFQYYSAARNNPYDEEEQDVEELVEPFRKAIYKPSGQTQDLGYGLSTPIATRASQIQTELSESGVPETAIADTTAFGRPDNDSVIQAQIDADETKTAVVEIYDGLEPKEQVCAFAFGLDALNFNIKTAKARSLARYGAHLMTMADANKLGVVTSQHVSLINGIQVAKSTAEGSLDLAFDQSEGYLLVSQGLVESILNNNGVVSDPTAQLDQAFRGTGGAARVATGGNPSLLYLNQIVGNLNTVTPVENAGSPLYTTEDLIAAYTSANPCDTLYAATGNPSSAQLQIMRLLIGQYMTPQFLLNKASAIGPDPRTDPEKGYGSGNAVAAGVGALASGIGRGIGLEALHQSDMPTIIAESNTTSFYPGYSGSGSKNKDNYRNDLCNDRTISGEGLATDMFCNIQWGYTNSVLLDETYAPRAVIDYLRAETDWPAGSVCYKDTVNNENIMIMGPDGYNDPGIESSLACLAAIASGLVKVPHINQDGEVKTQRYQDFMNNCIKTDKAIIDQNKWGENQYGAASAAYCATNTDEIFRFFRLFVFDSNILQAYKKSADGSLGKNELQVAGPSVNPLASSGSCPAGSTDYGMKEGWLNGTMVPIRTCGILDWPANFANSAGEMIVEVNSTIAADTIRLAQALKAAGLSYTASIAFRTYDQQKCIYDYFVSGNKGCSMFNTRPTDAASPGSSNHQMGKSIDIDNSKGTPLGNWLDQHMAEYGFSRDVFNRNGSDYGHMTHG